MQGNIKVENTSLVILVFSPDGVHSPVNTYEIYVNIP